MKKFLIICILTILCVCSYAQVKKVWVCTGDGAYKYHIYRNCRGLNRCRSAIKKIPIGEAKRSYQYTGLCNICAGRYDDESEEAQSYSSQSEPTSAPVVEEPKSEEEDNCISCQEEARKRKEQISAFVLPYLGTYKGNLTRKSQYTETTEVATITISKQDDEHVCITIVDNSTRPGRIPLLNIKDFDIDPTSSYIHASEIPGTFTVNASSEPEEIDYTISDFTLKREYGTITLSYKFSYGDMMTPLEYSFSGNK